MASPINAQTERRDRNKPGATSKIWGQYRCSFPTPLSTIRKNSLKKKWAAFAKPFLPAATGGNRWKFAGLPVFEQDDKNPLLYHIKIMIRRKDSSGGNESSTTPQPPPPPPRRL